VTVQNELEEATSTTGATRTSTVESDFGLSVSPRGLDDGAEPVVLVGSVVNCTGGSIGLNQAVGALHHVAISGLPLVLDVTGMRVMNGVVEFVVRWRLFKIIQFSSVLVSYLLI
jgi:hypothetical protein